MSISNAASFREAATFDFYLDAWNYAVKHRISPKLVKKVKQFNEKLLCFRVVYQLPNVRAK